MMTNYVFFWMGGVKEVRLGTQGEPVGKKSLCRALPRTDDHLWEERLSVIGIIMAPHS